MGMPTRLLPRIRSWKEYRRIFARTGTWTRAARHVATLHGLKIRRFEAVFPGTCGVLAARLYPQGKAIIKLFPPLVRPDHSVEMQVLRRLAAVPGFPAPRIAAQGRLRDRSEWGYLILEPRAGSPIREIRARMSTACLAACAAGLGRLLKRLHSLPVRDLAFPPARRLDNRPALKRTITAALRRLRRTGSFSAALREDIAARLPGLISPGAKVRAALVHGDVTEDHVLLTRRAGSWRLSGLIDFADAAIAPPLYEIMPLWFGAFARKPFMLRRFLGAYSPGLSIKKGFMDRATAFTLIHPFGPACIAQFLAKDGKDSRSMNWESLRDWLWPFRDECAPGGNK